MKRKQKHFWIIDKGDGTTAIARWVPGHGLVITDDARTLDSAVSDAADKGFEVHYCNIIHGIGPKTVAAICERIGHGWGLAARVTLPKDGE